LLGFDHVTDVVERDRPTATSSVAERDSGRITERAPVKSSCVNAGGFPSPLARAAARSAASRTSAARSATTNPVCDRELELEPADGATRKRCWRCCCVGYRRIGSARRDRREDHRFRVADLAALVREAALRAAARASGDGKPPALTQDDFTGALR